MLGSILLGSRHSGPNNIDEHHRRAHEHVCSHMGYNQYFLMGLRDMGPRENIRDYIE